jgi:hypothetical protein
MTKVEFTNWLHTEFDAVFHGDITPEQVMLNAIPMIDLFVSKNCGKPLVSGSLPHEPMQNRIAKAADKFLVDNSTEPHIDHWSFRMGARWMQNEMLSGNDR